MSWSEPDPQFDQFSVLQEAILQLLGGLSPRRSAYTDGLLQHQISPGLKDELAAELKDCLIWYDYFCVPQITQLSHVEEKSLMARRRARAAQTEVKKRSYFFENLKIICGQKIKKLFWILLFRSELQDFERILMFFSTNFNLFFQPNEGRKLEHR